MNRSRKDLINIEMSMIMRKHKDKMKISYGLRTRQGQTYDGRFHMYKRPQISAILDQLLRLN